MTTPLTTTTPLPSLNEKDSTSVTPITKQGEDDEQRDKTSCQTLLLSVFIERGSLPYDYVKDTKVSDRKTNIFGGGGHWIWTIVQDERLVFSFVSTVGDPKCVTTDGTLRCLFTRHDPSDLSSLAPTCGWVDVRGGEMPRVRLDLLHRVYKKQRSLPVLILNRFVGNNSLGRRSSVYWRRLITDSCVSPGRLDG